MTTNTNSPNHPPENNEESKIAVQKLLEELSRKVSESDKTEADKKTPNKPT